ncbi:hypothetical protein JK176_13820 [Gluconobacter sp. Dm-73]|nr:hypothetical protein [Gluconobacter sp. Dm-73]MBS1075942.1 hypothetical protein [Gluconobacter sp. Dm-73]
MNGFSFHIGKSDHHFPYWKVNTVQQDGFETTHVSRRDDALRQLEALDAFRSRLPKELACPWWNAPVMGGLLALLTFAMSLEPPFVFLLEGLCVALMGIFFAIARRRMGYFVNGYRRGRTRKIAIGMILAVYAMMALSGAGERVFHLTWLPWIATLGSFAIGYGVALLWRRVWQAGMTARL